MIKKGDFHVFYVVLFMDFHGNIMGTWIFHDDFLETKSGVDQQRWGLKQRVGKNFSKRNWISTIKRWRDYQ